ncbi:transcriptional regulator [Roseivirga sp. 4D4]|uniref:LytTR family transcriptional regulator DNA-binding domain-containing protein n=1 Tax=Roseivirga sp. 4D4 TaxID=1889784 RepID=UPI0008532784|nr:LytTR family transcriptional regulator DNA-binding domain-containing protein [Roseivirga sp. 4D4]OEK03689.1 transcriptional regulator [Roseivirga sp. 4D4]
MKSKYPFDPSLKHHLFVAFGIAVWVFVFLYFTEPLDVSELSSSEKLLYMPLYGIFTSICYLLTLPFQQWLFKSNNQRWSLGSELLQFLVLVVLGFVITRSVYYYIVMDQHPNAYTLYYFARAIYLPGILTIFPIIAIGRWSFGKYKEKKLEEQKIEIKGSGNYESLKLLLNDLICIQSSDNYVEITYKEDGLLKKQLIRNKLADVEIARPELIRTHRSFLINPFHFKQWRTGNRKINVVLSSDIEVPVSKTYQPVVEEAVNSTTE